MDELVVTGLGIATAVGVGKEQFLHALHTGAHAFGVMRRTGRQQAGNTAFLGAELPELVRPADVDMRLWRSASLSGRAALVCAAEAWQEAQLATVDPFRVGLVVGGSNLQSRETVNLQTAYADKLHFLRPTYGLTFLDSDLSGLLTQTFGIRGFGYTLGGASASGQWAVIQAAEAVRSRQVDVCLAVGGLLDLSYFECAGLRGLGAMGSTRFASEPGLACRPFDASRDGFIFGEACAVVVVENQRSAEARRQATYGRLAGWGVVMDANRNPDPSLEGECRVIERALQTAGWSPRNIDYVNPHGSGSVIGDEVELAALRSSRLGEVPLNTTKSITGHGLTAAGAVEVTATLLQMKAGWLHPSRNLEQPIDPSFQWIGERAREHRVARALSLSLGFGGINTALCLAQPDVD